MGQKGGTSAFRPAAPDAHLARPQLEVVVLRQPLVVQVRHLRLERVADAGVDELQLVGRAGGQQVALAPVARQVGEVGRRRVAVQVVEDRDALAAGGAGGGGDLGHLHSRVVGAERLVGPRLALEAHVHVGVPGRALRRRHEADHLFQKHQS